MGRIEKFVLVSAVALLSGSSAFAIGPAVPLVNASAEAGIASVDGMGEVAIPGWQTSGVPTVVRFDSPGPFPARENEVPGVNDQLFVGGPATGLATLSQTAVIPQEAIEPIDRGVCGLNAFAWLGGWQSEADSARVVVEVVDGLGAILTNLILGPVTATDRGGITSLKMCQEIRGIPSGARTVRVRVEMFGVDGPYNNAYADNIYVGLEFPDPVQTTTWGSIKAMR